MDDSIYIIPFFFLLLALLGLGVAYFHAIEDASASKQALAYQWDARNHQHIETPPEHVSGYIDGTYVPSISEKQRLFGYLQNCTNRGSVIYCDVDIER
jgi:hypothetical protein